MLDIKRHDFENFERYLIADEKSEDNVAVNKGVIGNISTDEIRSTEQKLFYLVVEKSTSMYYNELEEGITEGLKEVKKIVEGTEEVKCIQTAMTFFGSTIEMRPFKYGESIDITYKANERTACMYDAIIQSCINMTNQYDKLVDKCKVQGTMLIITDDGEFGSSKSNLNEVLNLLKELKKRDIDCFIVTCNNENSLKSSKRLGIETISIENKQQLKKLMMLISQKLCSKQQKF